MTELNLYICYVDLSNIEFGRGGYVASDIRWGRNIYSFRPWEGECLFSRASNTISLKQVKQYLMLSVFDAPKLV